MPPEYAAFAPRLHTASLYDSEVWTTDTIRLVVLKRTPPQFRSPYGPYQFTMCGNLAPEPGLRQALRLGMLPWAEFAQCYLAFLRSQSRMALWRDILMPALSHAPSVTFLGLERTEDEATVLCHRRMLRPWVLGEEVVE
jgi:hypothetical protein